MSSADYRGSASGLEFYFWEVEDIVEELLNDSYDEVDLCGYVWDSGSLLRQVDPIAFREVVLDYINSQIEDGEWVEL